jgi:uncharacterized damage-inducible protein DinB
MRADIIRAILFCLLTPAAAFAQSPPKENPLIAHNKLLYAGLKEMLIRSAEKMPEESYNFRPAEAVRTYGQIVGHLAESQYFFCSAALGEKNPSPKIEQTVTAKAELIAALKSAFAYCDRAYNGLNDAAATQTVKLFGGGMPKLGVLYTNQMHGASHYGNLVTYMRIRNIVPPSSEPGAMPRPDR